jgi:hypothetical protein
MGDFYALPRLIKSTKVLPQNILSIVSDYSGTDSIEQIINNIDLFEPDKLYEIVYYSDNVYDLVIYFKNKYTGVDKTSCTSFTLYNFSVPYKQHILHFTGQYLIDDLATGLLLFMMIKDE